MTKRDITFRKAVATAGCGLGGAVLGDVLAKFVVPKFFGSAPWLLPAMVVGMLAIFVVAALTVPSIIGERRRT
ncbi:hypothetical protein [Dyella mobilis]|uniref:Major facilitator superfamily (MFS) profile domain-containing protein n=1 Tax=Dyella mobilis TaxID=1849582 RepID=A0ABS2KDB7_9GAMM|nr:hypothetical protein [Dyella mobilis]MBM7128830.1 hypothetical protein [Dyella mobilis]